MELKESAYRISALAVSPDGRYVASGDVNADVTVWDIQNGKMQWKLSGHRTTGPATSDNWVWSAAFTADGRSLLTGGGSRVIKLWDAGTGRLIRELKGHEGSIFLGTSYIHSLAVFPDGRTAVSGGGDGTMRIWDIEKGTSDRSFPASEGAMGRGWVRSIAISADGRRLLTTGGDNTIRLWNRETGEELSRMRVSEFADRGLNSVVFANKGLWALSGGLKIRYWDLKGGTLIKEVPEDGCGAQCLSMSKDGKRLLTSGCNSIGLRDVDSGRLLKSYKGSQGWPASGIFDAALFHPNGRWIVSKGLDASVRIKDADTDEEIALFVGFPDGEWVVVTSEGYYNASEKGAQYLSVIVGDDAFGVDRFYDVFYRPDIVAAKLRGEDIRGLATVTMKDAIKSPPPAVEFTAVPSAAGTSRVKVCYAAKSAGGGIGEVRLFHNGKLISSDGYYREMARSSAEKQKLAAMNSRAIYEDMRSISVKGAAVSMPLTGKAKGDVFTDCREVEAVPGENEIGIAAFNGGNTIQSPVKTVRFHSSIAPEEPHLYILSVGVNRYRDETANLRYAVKDAQDLEEKLRTQSSTVYKPANIHYTLLKDQEATKSGIFAGISELSEKIKPQDSFILFAAGHGVLLQNQYYLLTHDYDGTVSEGSMISSNEIVEISKRIRSLSQLFIFDTCHAGGVDAIVSGLYDARMSVLAKKMGLHVYASAGDKQSAMDGYRGNGLFTHALLDGLDNKEADRNKDGKVTVVGLGNFAKEKTANLSKEIGHPQTPLIINFGKDYPLYRLR